jgi:hypothetical protein
MSQRGREFIVADVATVDESVVDLGQTPAPPVVSNEELIARLVALVPMGSN